MARCNQYAPALMCDSRSEAMHHGEMEYRAVVQRWYWPVNFALSEWPRNTTRFAWTFCPFCGGSLPDTEPPPATGGCHGEWSGEDGG